MRNSFSSFVVLALVGVVAFVYQDQTRTLISQASHTIVPCGLSVTYKIGTVDSRFDISVSQLEADIKQAAALWNSAAGRTLFAEGTSHGIVTINLMYDTRQATTQKLGTLGVSVNADTTSYRSVKAKYDGIYVDYQAKRSALATL